VTFLNNSRQTAAYAHVALVLAFGNSDDDRPLIGGSPVAVQALDMGLIRVNEIWCLLVIAVGRNKS
jgi:hypothetical protein